MSDKKRWIVCALLASVLIGMGLFQGITGIIINERVMYYVELGVMLGVLYFLVIYPKSRRNSETIATEEYIDEIEENEIEQEYEQEDKLEESLKEENK